MDTFLGSRLIIRVDEEFRIDSHGMILLPMEAEDSLNSAQAMVMRKKVEDFQSVIFINAS